MEQRLPGEGKDLLGRLMREGTLSPEVLDRLLGAYTIFEYRDGKCFRRHASETYLKMLYLDDATAQSFGDRDILEAIVPEDREELCRVFGSSDIERTCSRFRRIQRDGGLICLEMDMLLLKREADSALYCGILRDVTQEIQTSAELKASNSAFETIFHISNEDRKDMQSHLGWLNPNGGEMLSLLADVLPIGMIGGYCEEGFPLYFVSREMCRMMGYGSRAEFVAAIQGRVVNTIYYEDLDQVCRDLGDDYREGMTYTIAYRMPRKDGSLFWVLDKGRVIRT